MAIIYPAQFSILLLSVLLLQLATVLYGKKLTFPFVSPVNDIFKKDREPTKNPFQFVAIKVDSDTNDMFDADEDDGSYDSRQENFKHDSTSASFQVLITKRMRNILIKDLGYLPSEVDNMEPQIAAVVIERNLRRPRKGMPASWRKNAEDRDGNNFLIQCRNTVGNLFRGLVDITNNYLRPVLPIVIVSSLLFFQRHSILFVARSLLNSVKSINSKWKTKRFEMDDNEEEEELVYPSKRQGRSLFGWKKSGSSNRRISNEEHSTLATQEANSHVTYHPESDETKINLKTYEKVLSPSWWDQFPFNNRKND